MKYYDEDTVYELMSAAEESATAYEFGVHKSVDIKDYPSIELGWNTGRPTEEGLYAVYYWDDHNPNGTSYPALYDGFVSPNFKDAFIKWINSDGEVEFCEEDIVRWQKIEPYTEASE